LFQHPGTEFIYMLEGVMDYAHSRSVYRLHPGDSLQIDGEGAHGPADLIELPIRFLSVIAFPDSQV
jgi:quercetin dioxygenase-like cupin family protein